MWGRNNGNKLKPPFAAITKEMANSAAYKQLNHSSVRAFIHICLAQKDGSGDNIKFTYKQAAEFMKQETFNKAITQLVEVGFLDLQRSGACFGKKNIYKKSERWRKYDTPEFRKGQRRVVKQNPMQLVK